MNTAQPTVIERFIGRLKKNPVIALCIALGFVVIWAANFTEAVKKLKTNLPKDPPAAVAGRWESGPLQDVRTTLEYRYVFDLKTDGARVYGTAQRLLAYCVTNKASGLCAGQGRQVPIVDGAIDRKALSFACDWGEVPSSTPWAWVKLKETFRGSVDAAAIRFVQQDDQNNPPVDFEARLPAG